MISYIQVVIFDPLILADGTRKGGRALFLFFFLQFLGGGEAMKKIVCSCQDSRWKLYSDLFIYFAF